MISGGYVGAAALLVWFYDILFAMNQATSSYLLILIVSNGTFTRRCDTSLTVRKASHLLAGPAGLDEATHVYHLYLLRCV